MSPITAKLLSLALATVLVVGSGVAVADLVSADDQDNVSAIEIRKDDAEGDAELVEDDEDGDGDDTRGDDGTRGGDATRGDDGTGGGHTAPPAAAPLPEPVPAPAPVYSDDGGYSDGSRPSPPPTCHTPSAPPPPPRAAALHSPAAELDQPRQAQRLVGLLQIAATPWGLQAWTPWPRPSTRPRKKPVQIGRR